VSKKTRYILAGLLLVTGVLSMWARHAAQQAEKRKREELFRRLSTYSRPELLAPTPPPTPEAPPETRDMFDSTLPQESLELVRQAVGRDFKLMELSFGDEHVFVKVSSDGSTVQQYHLDKNRKSVDAPQPVQLIGDGKLGDSLYDPAAADLTLIPRLSKEALERAALPDARVTRVSLNYSIIRYAGEGPEWTVFVERGKVGEDWQYKHVTFNTKGKFKRIS
jgi:hypothetical protein